MLIVFQTQRWQVGKPTLSAFLGIVLLVYFSIEIISLRWQSEVKIFNRGYLKLQTNYYVKL